MRTVLPTVLLLACSHNRSLCSLDRSRRLARKAESARQARLRHKQFVTDLQDQAAGLQARIRELESHCAGPGSATGAIRELQSALSAEQNEQLRKWLVAAQGEDHVLARVEKAPAVPVPVAPMVAAGHMGSAPIAIGGAAAWGRLAHQAVSPMESDEDAMQFPMSRSWDDCEVARSILNLNSPNGFHPIAGGAVPPAAFSLGGGPMQPPAHGSMLSQPAPPMAHAHGSSMLSQPPPKPA
jgi:hypothetical protein